MLYLQIEAGPDFCVDEKDLEVLLKLLVDLKVTIWTNMYNYNYIPFSPFLPLPSSGLLFLSSLPPLSLPSPLSPSKHPNILSPSQATLYSSAGLCIARDFYLSGSLRDKIYEVPSVSKHSLLVIYNRPHPLISPIELKVLVISVDIVLHWQEEGLIIMT